MVRRMVPVQGRRHRPDGGARRWCAKMLVPLEQCQARPSATARMPGSTMEIYRHRGKAGEHDACRLGASDVRTAFISNGTGVATSRFVRLSAGGRRIRTCMGLSLSSGCFRFIASSLFGAGGAVLHPVAYDQVPGARAKGSRDRNASKAWRLAAQRRLCLAAP